MQRMPTIGGVPHERASFAEFVWTQTAAWCVVWTGVKPMRGRTLKLRLCFFEKGVLNFQQSLEHLVAVKGVKAFHKHQIKTVRQLPG